MLQKVKKLGSKLFGQDEEEGGSGGLRSPPSVTKAALGKGSYMEVDSPTGQGSFSKVGTSADPGSPSKGHLVLPPVQGHAYHNGANSPQSPPAVVAGAMPTGQGGSGRRKSTPAALDMALRTAEGKAAIEELINSAGKKQMVFGQYFGGSGNASQGKGAAGGQAGASAAAAAAGSADKTRFAKAGLQAAATKASMHTVMEQDDDAHHQAHAAKAATTSPKAVTSPQPSAAAHHAAHHHAHAAAAASSSHAAQPMDATPSSAARPAPVATPQKRPADAPAPTAAPTKQPAAMQVDEVPPARPTKILSMMQQLPTGMARKYWSLGDYSILRKMYTGYASTVYQATCKRSLEQVALKVYHMENLCELNHYQVYREIRVHSALSHQHIIQLYCAFQEGNDVVMVQEYAEGGDLYRLLHRNGGRLSERQAVEMVLHPFLLSLHYLHTRGIMHRDIKPENVLFTEHRVLKLADFGLAIDLTEERAVTRAGTLDYMAPEVLRCPPKNLPQENKNNVNLQYNNSVDAWAVGVFAYELVVGFPPFAGESQLASVDKIIHAAPEFPEKTSELFKAFVTAALKKHPGDRPTVMEMLHHPWIRTYQRRTSVLMPHQAVRRRSSVQYQGAGGAPGGLQPQPEEGPLPGAPDNLDNMTPEEIEKMIQRLQMAKHGIA